MKTNMTDPMMYLTEIFVVEPSPDEVDTGGKRSSFLASGVTRDNVRYFESEGAMMYALFQTVQVRRELCVIAKGERA